MKKKILITEFYNYSPILETGLELALKNLFKNNIVHYYFLGHSVQNDAGMIWPRIKDKIYLNNYQYKIELLIKILEYLITIKNSVKAKKDLDNYTKDTLIIGKETKRNLFSLNSSI